MPVKEVLKMGHPVLRQVAQPVTDFASPVISTLLTDMLDTMQALDGAGLAAPQIGVSLRVVIFAVESNPRYPEVAPIPLTMLINPEITPLSQELVMGWEGCLSIPGMRGLVPRFQRIGYRAYDPDGNRLEREVSGFHARVVQHEVDHLDGLLYPQRMTDMGLLGFEQENFPFPVT